MNQPLLIIGASARAAAQSAHRAGYHVIAADLFSDRDLIVVAETIRAEEYPSGFVKIVRELSAKHANLGVMYTGAIENYPDILTEIETHAMLWGNPADVVRSVRDPFQLQEQLRRHSIPFPRSQREPPSNFHSHRWLRKSVNSAGGLRVQFADPTDEATEDHFFQEWIEGQVCSAAFVGNGSDAELLGVSEMLVGTDWLGGDGFKYCGSVTKQCFEAEHDQWQAIGQLLSREFGLAGLFGVDAVLRDDEVVPIEVNPRYTASMELFDSDSGVVVQRHAQACIQQSLAASDLTCDGFRAKCIVYATETTNFPDDYTHLHLSGIELADIPRAQTIHAGHPILTMLAKSESRDDLIGLPMMNSKRIRDLLSNE